MSTSVPGYGLEAVTRGSFLAALSRVLGTDEAKAKWIEACQVASLSPGLEDPGPEDLERVAKALVELGGLPSVVGSSMYVRLVTYRTLSRKSATPAGGESDA